MKVICIAGLIGSGKNIAADYISQKYGYDIIDYADTLREICRKEGLEITRDNLQKLRLKHGNTFLAEDIVKKIKDEKLTNIILTPMRRSEDYEIPKTEFGDDVYLIVIDVDQRIRFERLRLRGRENDPKDFAEFQRQEKRENEIFNFDKTFSYADFTITNNEKVEEMYKQIDEIMDKIEN